VLDDTNFERDDRIERRIGDLGPVAAVDRGIGKMEQKIEHTGRPRAVRQQPFEEFGGFRPDAGQVCGSTEEGIEDGRAHRKLLV